MKKICCLLFLILCAGCSQTTTEDPYRTVPTTNNPNMFRGGVGPKSSPF